VDRITLATTLRGDWFMRVRECGHNHFRDRVARGLVYAGERMWTETLSTGENAGAVPRRRHPSRDAATRREHPPGARLVGTRHLGSTRKTSRISFPSQRGARSAATNSWERMASGTRDFAITLQTDRA